MTSATLAVGGTPQTLVEGCIYCFGCEAQASGLQLDGPPQQGSQGRAKMPPSPDAARKTQDKVDKPRWIPGALEGTFWFPSVEHDTAVKSLGWLSEWAWSGLIALSFLYYNARPLRKLAYGPTIRGPLASRENRVVGEWMVPRDLARAITRTCARQGAPSSHPRREFCPLGLAV